MAEADAQTQSRAHASPPAAPPLAEATGEPIRSPQVGAPNAASPMFPLMYPMLVPGMMYSQQGADDLAQGPGIYAIQENQFMGGYAAKTFVPLTYNIPTESVGALAGEEQGQDARQQNGPQRQVVVRRFHFAFQLDLALIIKLAAVVFLFSQEGSKQRLFLLILFASLIYLYQTGAITPFLRWLQRAGGVAARPPQAPANRAPLAAQNDGNNQQPGGNVADPANPDQAAENQEPGAAAGDENQQGAEGEANRRSWLGGILKEIQLVVVGFVASLLPGFQHND
ncbi:uncharacterized protein LOC124652569 isoform X2 [Lolium rigidum]|uniref:uncharacterized protein LOC124652569 isoform X2 n=1 Tax=Lolium rigidum TaxID=89674 RepID=UPI001F5D1096|nr:uncharacterized protein LOC124652569 isoform X2 [Lolium rigidum]